MNRELFNRFKSNKRELDLIANQIDRLNDRLENVPEVSGKVTKSSKDFPYIEEHMTVRMKEPKEATEIKKKLRKKEKRQEELSQEITAVVDFISDLPDGIEKQIMEMVYLEGMSQTDAAELMGYTQSMVSKIIKNTIKDS
ncbi:MAG: sigma factor-like helix-turn-helix DNA-binding protein [Dorea phocaeensis]